MRRKKHLGEEHSRQGEEQFEEQGERWRHWSRVDRREDIGHGDEGVCGGGAPWTGGCPQRFGFYVKFGGKPVWGFEQGSDMILCFEKTRWWGEGWDKREMMEAQTRVEPVESDPIQSTLGMSRQQDLLVRVEVTEREESGTAASQTVDTY